MNKRIPRNIQRSIDETTRIEGEIADIGKPAAPDPNAAPAPAAANPDPAPPPPADQNQNANQDPTNTPDYWKARFQTTEGINRTLREQHAEDLRTRDQQMRELQGKVEQLQQQVDNGQDPAADLDLTEHFSAEQIETHGEAHLRSVLAAAMRANKASLQQSIDRAIAPLKKELEESRNAVNQDREAQTKTAQEKYLEALVKAQPNWQAINADPRFQQYCAGVDERTGFQRQQILTAAHGRLDHERVAKFFSEYLKEAGVQTAPRNQDKQLHPDGVAAGGDNPPPLKPLVTEAEIRQFQADVSRGRYRGRPQEQADMQKRIDEAYQSGRVS